MAKSGRRPLCVGATEAASMLIPRIHSYVVRYDSGFAPNPFYGFCTLATCKPGIRKSAAVGDWIVGSGSNARSVRRGGHIVYAMRVTEAMSFDDYDVDPRFQPKKPFRKGSRKQSCGDNIYFRRSRKAPWEQRDSFHSAGDGSQNPKHVARDTGVNRVLISSHYVYFGGEGPRFPNNLKDHKDRQICKVGIGLTSFDDQELVRALEHWLRGLGSGYQGPPLEWLNLRK